MLSGTSHQEAHAILYVGLDRSRKTVDVHAIDGLGRTIEVTSVPSERASLLDLAARFTAVGGEVTASSDR